MHGAATGTTVGQLAERLPWSPAQARRPPGRAPGTLPAASNRPRGIVEQGEEGRLGGLVNATRDAATQPRSFPWTTMSLTAISLSVSPRWAASARAASSSKSW